MGWEDPLEEDMGTHSTILAWRIPWTEEPGGLQSMGLQRVGYDWMTKYSYYGGIFQVALVVKSLPANTGDIRDVGSISRILAWGISMDRRAWWIIVHQVAKSQTWLSDLPSCSCYGMMETGVKKLLEWGLTTAVVEFKKTNTVDERDIENSGKVD